MTSEEAVTEREETGRRKLVVAVEGAGVQRQGRGKGQRGVGTGRVIHSGGRRAQVCSACTVVSNPDGEVTGDLGGLTWAGYASRLYSARTWASMRTLQSLQHSNGHVEPITDAQ